MAANTQTLNYIIKFDAKGYAQFQQILGKMKTDMSGFDLSVKKMTTSTQGLGIDLAGLAARAAITIPIWLALRTAFMETLRTIGDGAKHLVEFDAAMRRMQAVSSNIADMPSFMKQLGQEVRDLSALTGKSVKEVSDVYYQFAETGMNATAAQAGMNTALKLSVATFADTAETARIMVDLYNMFGKSMGDTLNPQQKMQMIAGTFVTLWKENSGNLTEYINALKMFTPIAKNFNLSMKETLTTVVVLNNYMQRSSMGGTQLARAFNEMTKNADKFDEIGVNVRNRTDDMQMFLEVLTKINTMPAGTKGAVINQLFGERSQRGVSALAVTDALEKLISQLEKVKNLTPDDALKVLNDSFELQNKSLENQLKIFDQLRRRIGEAFLIGVMGATDYEDAIKKAGEALQTLNNFIVTTAIPAFQGLGNAIAFLVNNPLGQFISALLVAGQIIKTLPVLLAAITANPLGAGITALVVAAGTALTAYNAYKASKNNEKEAYLKLVREGAVSGKNLEDFMPSYMSADEAKYGAILSPETIKKRAKEKKLPASPNEIRDAFFNALNQQSADAGAKKAEADVVKAAQTAEESLKTKLVYANQLKALGYDSLQIEVEKYRIMQEAGADELKLAEQQVALVNEYADIMKNKLSSAFTEIMAGNKGFSSIGTAINESLVEGYRKSVSEGLTNVLMSTGLGELFGGSMASIKGVFGGISGKIEGAFDVGGKTTYNWIVRGFRDSQNTGKTGISTGGSYATFGGGAAAGIAGAVLGAGWFAQPVFGGNQNFAAGGGYNSGGVNARGQKMSYGNQSGITRGQLAYGGVQAALTGYSSYQSAQAAGASGAASMGAGMLGGLGGLAGGIAGGLAATGGVLLGMGPVGWAVLAGALIVGSMFLSSGGKKQQTQTSIETSTQEMRVASKIDVSNKKLELINRNLVALRNTMETYILPSSAYFSTARNLEDEFALSARRG